MSAYQSIKKGATLFTFSLLGFMPLASSAGEGQIENTIKVGDGACWQDFVSSGGNYKVSFPSYPQHVSETLKLQGGKVSIKYDAYIAELGVEALYMVLIAEYPKTHVRPDPEAGLKAFLNGILSHGESSRLVEVEWQEFQGFSAVDFLVDNTGILLRGRAVMVDNSLYLIAMESHQSRFRQENFKYFVETFSLVKGKGASRK